MMELALTLHNRIRENHIDTESLKLARDLSEDAQEYAEQLRLVETFRDKCSRKRQKIEVGKNELNLESLS